MNEHQMRIALALIAGLSVPASAAQAPRETPRQHVAQVFELATKWQPDARLVLVNGGANLEKDGQLKCAMADKVGWYFKFYSEKADRFYYAIACGDELSGEMADKHDRSLKNLRPIPKTFADTPAVAASVRKLQKKRGQTRCGSMMAKLLFGQPDDHGEALADTLLWDVYYQCSGDKDATRRALLDGKTALPLKDRN